MLAALLQPLTVWVFHTGRLAGQVAVIAVLSAIHLPTHQEFSTSVFTSISPSGTDAGSGGPSSSAVVTFFCITCTTGSPPAIPGLLILSQSWSYLHEVYFIEVVFINEFKKASMHTQCLQTTPFLHNTSYLCYGCQILTSLTILQITL